MCLFDLKIYRCVDFQKYVLGVKVALHCDSCSDVTCSVLVLCVALYCGTVSLLGETRRKLHELKARERDLEKVIIIIIIIIIIIMIIAQSV